MHLSTVGQLSHSAEDEERVDTETESDQRTQSARQRAIRQWRGTTVQEWDGERGRRSEIARISVKTFAVA